MSQRIENAPRFADIRPTRTDKLLKLAENGFDGLQWYAIAEREISRICKLEHWNIERFVSVLAITSPRCAVRRNVRNTLQFMATGALLDNTLGAIRVSLDNYLDSGKISGQKISAFRDALLGDTTAVVLDVHMANALCVPQSGFSNKILRERCTQRVVRVADRLNVAPRDAQACLWYGAMREANRKPDKFPLLWEYGNFRAYGGSFPTQGTIRQFGYRDGSYQRALFDKRRS